MKSLLFNKIRSGKEIMKTPFPRFLQPPLNIIYEHALTRKTPLPDFLFMHDNLLSDSAFQASLCFAIFMVQMNQSL